MTKSEEMAVRRIVRDEIVSALMDLAQTGEMWDGVITSSMVRETLSAWTPDKSDEVRTETAGGE